MACPHWFPKQDTSYVETGYFFARKVTLYPEREYLVSGNRWLCCQKWPQSILFPDRKYPISGTSVDRP